MPGFMVSMTIALHQQATEYADNAGISFSRLVQDALVAFMEQTPPLTEAPARNGGDDIARFMTEANAIRTAAPSTMDPAEDS